MPPGIASAVYGDVVGHSDFELNLSPPEESLKDVETSLDAVMQLEEVKRKASDADFTSAKQRFLEAEKIAIRGTSWLKLEPLTKMQ